MIEKKDSRGLARCPAGDRVSRQLNAFNSRLAQTLNYVKRSVELNAFNSGGLAGFVPPLSPARDASTPCRRCSLRALRPHTALASLPCHASRARVLLTSGPAKRAQKNPAGRVPCGVRLRPEPGHQPRRTFVVHGIQSGPPGYATAKSPSRSSSTAVGRRPREESCLPAITSCHISSRMRSNARRSLSLLKSNMNHSKKAPAGAGAG